jgi:hypothetical protein
MIALVVLSAALFAGRRVRLMFVTALTLGVVLLSTAGVNAYREVLWSGVSVDDALADVTLTSDDETGKGPAGAALRRFHVLDSLLLTVDLVPDVFPFANRNVLLEGATRGVIPRLLMPDKAPSDEGLRFQTQFWSYYDNPTREEATASIAPSMPGSLYEAGGWPIVLGGAFLWAALLTLVDRAMAKVPSAAAVALYVLCAVPALAGIERDFVLAFSSLTQMLIVFISVALMAQVMEYGIEAAGGDLRTAVES